MRQRGAIHLDPSRSSGILVVCDDCPHWWAFQFDTVAAWRSAANHEELCHPERVAARKALQMAMTRR